MNDRELFEQADDPEAAVERAFLEWLDGWARREADGTYQDALRAAFEAGVEYGRLET